MPSTTIEPTTVAVSQEQQSRGVPLKTGRKYVLRFPGKPTLTVVVQPELDDPYALDDEVVLVAADQSYCQSLGFDKAHRVAAGVYEFNFSAVVAGKTYSCTLRPVGAAGRDHARPRVLLDAVKIVAAA